MAENQSLLKAIREEEGCSDSHVLDNTWISKVATCVCECACRGLCYL